MVPSRKQKATVETHPKFASSSLSTLLPHDRHITFSVVQIAMSIILLNNHEVSIVLDGTHAHVS